MQIAMRKAAAVAPQEAVPVAAVCLPLTEAVLCLSCNLIYQGKVCPKCGDPYGWLIGRWISTRAA